MFFFFNRLKHGVTKSTSTALSFFTNAMIHFLPPSKLAVEFGKAAWKLGNEYNDPKYLGTSSIGKLSTCVFDSNENIPKLDRIIMQSVQASKQVNDTNGQMYLLVLQNFYHEFFALSLPSLLSISKESYKKIIFIDKNNPFSWPFQGSIFSAYLLVFNKELPKKLPEDKLTFKNEKKLDTTPKAISNMYYMYLLRTYILLRDYDKIQFYFTILSENIQYSNGVVTDFIFQFWSAMAIIFCNNYSNQEKLDYVKNRLDILSSFSKVCSFYYQHKFLCLQAEYLRLQDDSSVEILEYYEEAIQLAKKNRFLSYAAFYCERANSFCDSQGLPVLSEFYKKESYKFYSRWGANAKCSQLRINVPLFQPQSSHSAYQPQYTSDFSALDSISNSVSAYSDIKDVMQLVAKVSLNFFFLCYNFKHFIMNSIII